MDAVKQIVKAFRLSSEARNGKRGCMVCLGSGSLKEVALFWVSCPRCGLTLRGPFRPLEASTDTRRYFLRRELPSFTRNVRHVAEKGSDFR